MTNIHSTAQVDPGAKLGADVQIGPFCTIGPDVELGDRALVMSHVAIEGRTKIGAECKIFPFASVGLPPQDIKYNNEPSSVTIGPNTLIREHVTIHRGTSSGHMATHVGANCFLMIGAHIAHDCHIGDNVTLVNGVTLGGHVSIGDNAIIGGLSAVHQFVRIGHNAMIGGMSGVESDVIPYGMAFGERACLQGINIVGLKRGGVAKERIRDVLQAYETLFHGTGTQAERTGKVATGYVGHQQVGEILSFMEGPSTRALLKPK